MATYAIGDVQGCFRTFLALLRLVDFRPGADRLWMAGDLVNRGPDSLGVLRWMRDNEASVTVVLGNHDIHLIARAMHISDPKRRDTLEAVLAAPDRDALLAWLVRQPLAHSEGRNALVHGGLLPSWSFAFAEELARGVEAALRAGRLPSLMAAGKGRKDLPWSDGLTGDDRYGAAMRLLTNLRVVDGAGRAAMDYSGPPDVAPGGYVPWFAARAQHGDDPLIYFGHWSALGYHRAPAAVCLDSGCIWGQSLTAVRLEDGSVFQQATLEGTLH